GQGTPSPGPLLPCSRPGRLRCTRPASYPVTIMISLPYVSWSDFDGEYILAHWTGPATAQLTSDFEIVSAAAAREAVERLLMKGSSLMADRVLALGSILGSSPGPGLTGRRNDAGAHLLAEIGESILSLSRLVLYRKRPSLAPRDPVARARE